MKWIIVISTYVYFFIGFMMLALAKGFGIAGSIGFSMCFSAVLAFLAFVMVMAIEGMKQ